MKLAAVARHGDKQYLFLVGYWLYVNVFILCCCVPAISGSTSTFINTVTESRIIATSNTPPSAFSRDVITSSLDDALPFKSSRDAFASASSNTQGESVLPTTSGDTPVSISPSITNVTPAQLPTSTEKAETGTDKRAVKV